jgi:hypothetical protein
MKPFRIICFVIAALSAGYASFLSYSVDEKYEWSTSDRGMDQSGIGVSVAIDSAKDGAAAGFATLSGLALVAASITYLKR